MITVRKLLLKLLTLVLHLLRQTLTQNDHIRALAMDLLKTRLELLHADLRVFESVGETIALGSSGVEGVLLVRQRTFDCKMISISQWPEGVRSTYRRPRSAQA